MSGSGQVAGRPSSKDEGDGQDASARTPTATPRPLLDDVDGLLDEIDAVLEVNAEEFVRGYVQKGGE
jgi:ubiquitin-like protein Pup